MIGEDLLNMLALKCPYRLVPRLTYEVLVASILYTIVPPQVAFDTVQSLEILRDQRIHDGSTRCIMRKVRVFSSTTLYEGSRRLVNGVQNDN